MSKGLQFNDTRERHFAADFSHRYFIGNRKTLIIVNLTAVLWMLWLDQALPDGLTLLSIQVASLTVIFGIMLAILTAADFIKLRFSLFLGFYVLALQIALITVGFDPSLKGMLPQLMLPLLLPGILFRLRFVYVMPFGLLTWVLQFFSVNFLTHSSLLVYSQWAQLTTLLLIANLIVSYQFEQESRRRFAAVFPQHAMTPERSEHAS
jgi:hypothetical protein